jgi:hypothetical protein
LKLLDGLLQRSRHLAGSLRVLPGLFESFPRLARGEFGLFRLRNGGLQFAANPGQVSYCGFECGRLFGFHEVVMSLDTRAEPDWQDAYADCGERQSEF